MLLQAYILFTLVHTMKIFLILYYDITQCSYNLAATVYIRDATINGTDFLHFWVADST